MVSSEEDPRSKRGGHLLFDHSFFPDLTILRVRNKNFTISASYLALHSPYFYDLFYGPNSTELNGRYVLDFDPDVFGDLLDFIYPCYKKTNCCADCSSSRANRLDLALQLELRLAVKRLIKDVSPSATIMSILKKHNAVASYSRFFDKKYAQILGDLGVEQDNSISFDPLPVSTDFPDSTIVYVRGMSMLVSATALSLQSSILYELLYKEGELMTRVKIDVDLNSFINFLQVIAGDPPIDYTVKFLDDLLILGAKGFYDYFMSEIRMKSMRLSSEFTSYSAVQLLEHYCNQPNPDLGSMKFAACYLSIDQFEEVLSKFSSLPPSVVDELRNSVNSAKNIQIFAKTLTGKTITLDCPRGAQTSVFELKMRYEEKEGVPADQQRMIFASRDLEDGNTLGFYKIERASTVHTVLRLSGC